MQNSPLAWNRDVVAFLCTGRVEVIITRLHFVLLMLALQKP